MEQPRGSYFPFWAVHLLCLVSFDALIPNCVVGPYGIWVVIVWVGVYSLVRIRAFFMSQSIACGIA
jgi:hypothetical protein